MATSNADAEESLTEAAAAAATAAPAGSVTAPTPPAKNKPKHPCGACSKSVTRSTRSIHCAICEFWFHYDCVDGMTELLYTTCSEAFRLYGVSTFFCKCCLKATSKMKSMMKELRAEVDELSKRVTSLEKEKEKVTKRVVNVEEKAEKVKESIQDVEKEVASGMKTAKEEVKKEVKIEMKAQEERSANIVIYGIEESKKESVEERTAEDRIKVGEMARHVEVEVSGVVDVKYRAGKKSEEAGAKPRPMIVRVSDDETRERLLANARKLMRVEGWQRVFISPDMTWEQREEGRKIEKELRDQAEAKTAEATNEGKKGKFIVVGPRGKRRITWKEERE